MLVGPRLALHTQGMATDRQPALPLVESAWA
jgi:hypothetical protein